MTSSTSSTQTQGSSLPSSNRNDGTTTRRGRSKPVLRIQLWCRKLMPCCHPRHRPQCWERFCWTITDCLGCFVDYLVLCLGPILICAASAIIAALTNCYFTIYRHWTSDSWRPLHDIMVAFLFINVTFNYIMCVFTRSSGNKGSPTQYYRRNRGAASSSLPLTNNTTITNSCGTRLMSVCCLMNPCTWYHMFQTKISLLRRRRNTSTSTRPMGPFGRVVRELADATNFKYPESSREVSDCRDNYEQLLAVRREAQRQREIEQRRRFVEHGGAGTAPFSVPPASSPPRGWMLLGPREWGFCFQTNQPKPPRSHYDHVTKSLVLNLDHYCPWMFNAIGYMNYRYFCNFMSFVWLSMVYGLFLTWYPFWNMDGDEYRRQIILSSQKFGSVTAMNGNQIHNMIPWVPTPYQRTPVAFCFMICLSVGIAISGLLGFHLYLILTAQTTIEFHGNIRKRRNAKSRGVAYVNPYDLGYRRNWQQVYGTRHPVLAVIIPSLREPEFLPLPMLEDAGRHIGYHKKDDNGTRTTNGELPETSIRRDDEEDNTETRGLLLVDQDSSSISNGIHPTIENGHRGTETQRRRHVASAGHDDDQGSNSGQPRTHQTVAQVLSV